MPELKLPRSRVSTGPNVFQVARDLYGVAFEPKTRGDLGEAMTDWLELSDADRSFVLGHLLYLNLQGLGSAVRLLRDIREVLEDLEDTVQSVADDWLGDESKMPDSPDVSDHLEFITEGEPLIPESLATDASIAVPGPEEGPYEN